MEEGKQILTIVDQTEVASWPREDGKGTKTLYSVKALDKDGVAIEEALRTFAELPLGKAMEFLVRRYDHPRHGLSWTISRPRENTADRIQKLEQRVSDLTDRVSALEAR